MTVTNLLFNPIDATIAMLTSCGDPKRFFVRHNAFLSTQDKWLPKARDFSREQQQRWYQGSNLESMRAIASDFGFYATMEMWGSDRAQVDACLANPAMIAKLKQQQAEVRALGIESTPSFILNGEKLDAHDWAAVSKAITAKLAEQRAGNI
jgi:2-hydroxychromene-2-carboxylate isomerase